MSFGNEREFIDFQQAKEGVREVPKCPTCGKELNTIRYTEHGTLELDRSGEWLKTDRVEDCEYYCLECGHKFDNEELEELGVV